MICVRGGEARPLGFFMGRGKCIWLVFFCGLMGVHGEFDILIIWWVLRGE